MHNLFLDQVCYMCAKYGLEIIINDGEVVGFERLDIDKKHRSFNYFLFANRPKYAGK